MPSPTVVFVLVGVVCISYFIFVFVFVFVFGTVCERVETVVVGSSGQLAPAELITPPGWWTLAPPGAPS